ncbi:MAG: VanZ family protein [Candidatus Krumholzibacteria bacterium]|nr:VanZ family protein [Candidatus Krumholzibacteria bacterium]
MDQGLKRNLRRWIPLSVWIAVIFGISSIPNASNKDISLPLGFDKVAHFFEYFILTFLFHRGLGYGSKGKSTIPVYVVVVLGGMGIAALDEFYQSFVPGRDSSFFDVLADVTGIVLVTVVMFLRGRGDR